MNGLRSWLWSILLAGLLVGVADVSSAQACPMCKNANESQSHLPRAYQFSILFMLVMPAMLFSGIGFGLYRISKHESAVAEQLEQDPEGLDDPSANEPV